MCIERGASTCGGARHAPKFDIVHPVDDMGARLLGRAGIERKLNTPRSTTSRHIPADDDAFTHRGTHYTAKLR
jgi:hypothetical protein